MFNLLRIAEWLILEIELLAQRVTDQMLKHRRSEPKLTIMDLKILRELLNIFNSIFVYNACNVGKFLE